MTSLLIDNFAGGGVASTVIEMKTDRPVDAKKCEICGHEKHYNHCYKEDCLCITLIGDPPYIRRYQGDWID
jgi:hypothetical protein